MSCISIQCLRRDIEQAGRHTCHCIQQARQPVAKKNSMLIVLELASTRCYLTVDWGTPFPVPLLRSTLLLPLLLLPDFLSLSVILPAEKVLLPGRRRLPEARTSAGSFQAFPGFFLPAATCLCAFFATQVVTIFQATTLSTYLEDVNCYYKFKSPPALYT